MLMVEYLAQTWRILQYSRLSKNKILILELHLVFWSGTNMLFLKEVMNKTLWFLLFVLGRVSHAQIFSLL